MTNLRYDIDKSYSGLTHYGLTHQEQGGSQNCEKNTLHTTSYIVVTSATNNLEQRVF